MSQSSSVSKSKKVATSMNKLLPLILLTLSFLILTPGILFASPSVEDYSSMLGNTKTKLSFSEGKASDKSGSGIAGITFTTVDDKNYEIKFAYLGENGTEKGNYSNTAEDGIFIDWYIDSNDTHGYLYKMYAPTKENFYLFIKNDGSLAVTLSRNGSKNNIPVYNYKNQNLPDDIEKKIDGGTTITGLTSKTPPYKIKGWAAPKTKQSIYDQYTQCTGYYLDEIKKQTSQLDALIKGGTLDFTEFTIEEANKAITGFQNNCSLFYDKEKIDKETIGLKNKLDEAQKIISNPALTDEQKVEQLQGTSNVISEWGNLFSKDATFNHEISKPLTEKPEFECSLDQNKKSIIGFLGCDEVPTLNKVTVLIITLTQFLLSIAAIVAIIFILLGGIRMVTSAGNMDSIMAAKSGLTAAVVGL
ncbi:MAG: hypothetical protein UT60_C0040G0021, partial [candidate division CPR2 bacterium GW2011_GWD2_39_7]